MDITKKCALWTISKNVRLPAQFERVSELTHLKQLIHQIDADCVVDVGANRGQFSEELRMIGYDGLIFSFEPVRSEFSALQNKFRDDQKWRGYQLALGAKNESTSIRIPKLTVMSSILPSVNEREAYTTETIDIKRLDEFLPTVLPDVGQRRVFLKTDTQGFDLEVFRGSAGILPSVQGLQAELSVQPIYQGMPHYLESLQEYESMGFDLYNLSVVNRTATGGLLEMNCLMRRADRQAPGS